MIALTPQQRLILIAAIGSYGIADALETLGVENTPETRKRVKDQRQEIIEACEAADTIAIFTPANMLDAAKAAVVVSLSVGQRVHWTDPDNDTCSGYGVIVSVDDDGVMFRLKMDSGSETGAYSHELAGAAPSTITVKEVADQLRRVVDYEDGGNCDFGTYGAEVYADAVELLARIPALDAVTVESFMGDAFADGRAVSAFVEFPGEQVQELAQRVIEQMNDDTITRETVVATVAELHTVTQPWRKSPARSIDTLAQFNADRAERGEAALLTTDYDAQDENDRETYMGDVIANLMHLANREGLDFYAALNRGRDHYDAEVREEADEKSGK